MVSRYESIDVRTFEAHPHERSYIKISKLSDPNDFVKFEYNEFESFKINLTTGNVFFHGRINLNSNYLINWKSDKKDVIRNIEVYIVRAGNVDYYQFKAGIQTYFEDYTFLRFFVLLRHDNGKIGQKQYHAIKPINYPLSYEFKIDYDTIKLTDAKTGSLINFGLAVLGMGVIIGTAPMKLTFTLGVTALLGSATLFSTTAKVVCEITGNTDSWFYENNDLLQEVTGVIFKEITKATNKYLDTNFSESKAEQRGENLYFFAGLTYSILSSTVQIKRLINSKSYSSLAKRNFEEGYLRIENINYQDSFNNIVQSAQRTFKGKTWAGDVLNAITIGKTGYDKAISDFPQLKQFKRPKNSDEKME